MNTLSEYFEKQMASPAFRSAYEDARARNELRAALVARRKEAGLTQAQVASRMNVKQPTVSEFEDDSADPWFSSLQRYAWAVGAVLTVVVSDAPES